MQDFHKLMSTYKKWHMEFAPKLQFDYFVSKVQSLGNKKKSGIPDHMQRLRQVYKGEEPLFFEILKDKENNEMPEDLDHLAESKYPLKASFGGNQFNIEKAQAQ